MRFSRQLVNVNEFAHGPGRFGATSHSNHSANRADRLNRLYTSVVSLQDQRLHEWASGQGIWLAPQPLNPASR